MFGGLEGWGFHFLASMRPIDLPTPLVLAGRMPAAAVADMLEWGPAATGQEQLRLALSREIPAAVVEAMTAGAPPLSDDRPYNEYFFLRVYLWSTMAP
jgi:hypothetical protein